MLSYWLPLNGNLNNNGLSSLSQIPSATLTYNDNGKIGKCFQSGSQYISLPLETVPTALTICFWVKPDSPGSWCDIFSFGVNNNRMEVSTTTQYYWFCDSSSTALVDSGTPLFTLDNAVWNHICMTADGTTVKFYRNGSLVKTVPQINSFSTVFGSQLKLNIGSRISGSSMFLYKGYINDFRVYTDEIISLKQLQQIKSALCCHYKLSNQYETGQVNKYSGDVADGYLSGSFTRTKLEDERGYNYKLTYTGTGSNNWPNMKAGNFSFTAGKKYYYSCKVRCHSTNFNMNLRASRSDNDWVTSSTNVLSKADGEWHEYVVPQTINSTYDRSGSTVTSNPTLEFYTDNLITSGKVYSADFDIKDVQVIESDCYVPFIDNSMMSTVVSDCSGYGNNGTKVGTIAWSGDSARYSGSYYFASKSHYKIPCPLASPQEFSCSFWIKPISWGGYAIISSNYNNPSSGFWLAVNCEGYGLWFYNGSYARSNKGLLSPNTWYHVCFVFNKGIITWYQNGEVAGITDLSSKTTTLGIKDYISIGNSFTGTTWNTNYMGNISDFRIYSTALTESDIKSLYNVSASIDKTGVLSAYEFVEEG